MAIRASTRNMQTIRFVIDADASAAPFVYTLGQAVEICEIRTLTTAAVGFTLTIRNGANSITTVTSGGAIGDVDAAVTLAPAYINVAAGGTITVQTNAAGARLIATIFVLPGTVSGS
jgi:hypothetical protein